MKDVTWNAWHRTRNTWIYIFRILWYCHYWCFYLHTSRDLAFPSCGIFLLSLTTYQGIRDLPPTPTPTPTLEKFKLNLLSVPLLNASSFLTLFYLIFLYQCYDPISIGKNCLFLTISKSRGEASGWHSVVTTGIPSNIKHLINEISNLKTAEFMGPRGSQYLQFSL